MFGLPLSVLSMALSFSAPSERWGAGCLTHLSHREVMKIMFTKGFVLCPANACIEALSHESWW